MANEAQPAHGQICWNELMTPNAQGAEKFYGELFGWKAKATPMGDFTYHMLSAGGKDFGGIMPMTGPMWQGVPPHWMMYVAVADVDAAAKKVVELGGKVCVPPTDIPVGRFAVVNDPQGATFSLFQFRAQ
jgi:predicted enzyme related to lactoylglutathione lyase